MTNEYLNLLVLHLLALVGRQSVCNEGVAPGLVLHQGNLKHSLKLFDIELSIGVGRMYLPGLGGVK